MLKLINLGLTILSIIIKVASNNETASNVTDGVLRLFDIAESDILSQRKAVRSSEEIADQITTSCVRVLDHHTIDDARKDVIIDKIIATVNRTKLTYDLIILNKAHSDAVYRLFLSNTQIQPFEFDSNEIELIEHLLHHISGIIVSAALQCPQFANHGIKHLVSGMENLQLRIEDILTKIEMIDDVIKAKDFDAQKYERIYRNNIKERYGWIRLLGANALSREEKRYQLSIAYVSLEMAQSSQIGDMIASEDLFNYSNTIWIEGDAGSGKTTFLQWIAVTSASNNADSVPQIENTLPIMVELRSQNCKELSLKKAVESIMLDSDCSMPANWLANNLESGKAIILIDGVDEVKPEERENVLTWIERLRHQYPKSRIFVTSRPQVDKKMDIDYDEVKILPMSRTKIEIFLDYWHNAVLVEKLGITKNDAASYKQKLSIQIDNSTSIRRLVTNPLLCAMICALSYKNGTIISTQRNALYDDCCKMLFGNRDKERDIHAFEHIKLTYEEKKIILAQLAYWMMMNGQVVAETDDVLKCIKRAQKGLKPESQIYSTEVLYDYFLERSGVLRTPETGKIDFIHKSFQEYLSAYEIHRQDAWGYISSKARDIEWYDTLVLSMGFASEKNSKRVINAILKGTDSRSIIVAAACAANAPTLTPQLRQTINSQLAGIIPPKTISESQRLASAGEFVVPFLQYSESNTSEENYCCLIALTNIASEQVLPMVATHLQATAETRTLLCIDRILSCFTEREIRASGITSAIQNYICSAAKQHRLEVPESFLIYLESEKNATLVDALINVKELIITEYYDMVSDETLSLFSNVENLTVVGEFESFYILSLFKNTLKSAIVCDTGRECDIYTIANVSLPLLEKFHFHSAKQFYIDGSGLDGIYQVRELGLFLYNNQCQLYFDCFHHFTRLERIDLFTEFAHEPSYAPLVLDMKVKQLRIMLPADSFQIDQESLESELASLTLINKSAEIDVIDFDYPFGYMKD